jgi:hypothetical protein
MQQNTGPKPRRGGAPSSTENRAEVDEAFKKWLADEWETVEAWVDDDPEAFRAWVEGVLLLGHALGVGVRTAEPGPSAEEGP